MTNPINGINPGKVPVSPGAGKPSAAAKNASPAAEGAAPATDVVNFTDAAETLQEIEKSLADNAKISSEKVAAIKEALSSGQYQIDPDLIAEKFLEVERALGKV